MRILFVKPPLNRFMISTKRYEPLEFEYLAASVAEHDVEIFDMRFDKNLSKKLRTFKPEVVGTTSYTCDVNTVKQLLKEVKLHDPQIKTIVGGHHATFVPGEFTGSNVDTVFIGYADHTFKKYIGILANDGKKEDLMQVNNIGIVKDGNILFTEMSPFAMDLDALPRPARHLTEKYRYHNSFRQRVALLMSSRGCPYRCTFCACWKLMKGKYAVRNVDDLIEEIKSLPDATRVICFSDDNTIHNVKRAWELAEKIKANNIKKRFVTYARADTIVKNPDLMNSLKEAGFTSLTVGFESYKDEGLHKLNKKTSVQINNEAIRVLKKLGIGIHSQFIVDPGFSRQDFADLYRYVCEKHLYRPVFPVLTPLPGTELYKETCRDLVIRDYDFYDFAHSVLPTKLERKEFYKRVVELYVKSYSFKRYFLFRKARAKNKLGELKQSTDFYAHHMDGFSFFTLLLSHIFPLLQVMKYARAYRFEPLPPTVEKE